MSKILRFIPLLILLLSFNLSAQSPKRGLAYGYHTQEDMNVLKEGISWWYNWSSQPDAGVANYYQSLGVEFVPMFWNNNFNVEEAIENIPEGAKYILAYNEPNFYVEANISPQYAASVWYKIEQVAAARGLQIVSASPAYCGGNACPSEYYDPTKWHDEFFAECPECWVDYIAFHTYEGNPYGAIALTNNLKKYGRPIWVTEFANWDSNQSQEDKIEHMQIMVNAYENDPDIFRYSWFTGRASSNPSINILGSNGTLTPLGTAYLSASYTQKKYNVPGKIEAENHYRRNRTNLENTTDDGAGQNVSHIDAGDWGDYLVQIDQSGSYTFQFRVASLNGGGNLNILLDGELIKSNVEIPLTGGWQNWTTVEVPGVVLTGGEHLIRFYYSAGGFNLNYFTTVYESDLPPNADFTASSVSTCLGNSVIFSDATTNKIGSEVYNWNFGTDATPATASGAGPHSVIYSTPGFKTVSLEVINSNGSNTKTKSNFFVSGTTNGCLFSDGFDNNIVNWITPIPGAFSHSEADGAWKITNNGYGEWENFQYTINNGSEAVPINFSCTANKPILKVRAKASGICLLTATLVDVNGRAVDNYPGINMELTNSYQIFTIDFSQHFRNYHSANPGILDSTYIERIQFAINPGYYSYPYSGINANYNTAFNGTVEIDWIGIGDNCSPPLTQLPAITSFTPACITEGTQVTITGNYLSNANNVTFNGLAGTIISNTASQIVAAAPSGVTAGKISITTAEGSVTSEESFNLTPFADAGNDQNVSSYTATLTANAASGTWTLISGAGNIKNPNTPTTTVSALQNGANTFRWTVQNGSCTAYDEVTINASVTPLGNISGPTLVANGTQQTYSVTGTGPYTWIVPDGVVIVEGQGTNTIKVYFEEASGGNIEVVNEEGGISSSITITMDQPTSVHLGSDNYWQIFPNPFKESTLLRINSEQPQKLSIKVVDITGSSLYHSDNYFTNESIVIGNNLPNGIYILIINYNNSVKTFKLIKAE